MSNHLDDLAAFLTACPSSYHAASMTAQRLVDAGYASHREHDRWDQTPGGHVVVRDGAVLAWWIPEDLGEDAGFRIVCTHTDSPSFKLKPFPSITAAGWQQAGVELYGSPILNSWLDREVGLAGRVITRDGVQRLVRTGMWLSIPQLAPHLDRTVNEALVLDKQQHLLPICGLAGSGDIMTALADEIQVAVEDIAGHDLVLYSDQEPVVFGINNEFLAAGRLDNLVSVHAGLAAMLAAEECGDIAVLACFDHEEVGSATRTGASGPFLEHTLIRIAASQGVTNEGFYRMLAASSGISADAGHAVHPNHAQLHDPTHRPMVNRGPVLKVNSQQRYASDAVGAALWQRICDVAGIPSQTFVSNNMVPCGSTTGPLAATRLGIVCVDVGIPLLAMHSAREMCGVDDPDYLANALTAYFSGA